MLCSLNATAGHTYYYTTNSTSIVVSGLLASLIYISFLTYSGVISVYPPFENTFYNIKLFEAII
jgi:hypothetical protein